MSQSLKVVIIKPSKYLANGTVERFHRGFMPNSTVPHMHSMVPPEMNHLPIETQAIDEYVYADLQYLKLPELDRNSRTLVALVGDAIYEYLDVLQSIAPNWASFYILCPIPGTKQYRTFLKDGLITELNLDRFDTTCLTWNHPNLSETRLSELLYECYSKFASLRHSVQNIRNVASQHGRGTFIEKLGSLAMSSYIRFCAWRKSHPMSGGILRVRLDRVSEYIDLRKRLFGNELAPLPKSLKMLSPESPVDHVVETSVNSQSLSVI
jgi:hypothetical protein